jgi:hypothetical protein
VTIVVAALGPLIDVHDPADAEEVRRWLEAISQVSSAKLVAVEVIWAPTADQDQMSSVELETYFPELKRIRGGVVVGNVGCYHCGRRFPVELLSCPHCATKVGDAA